LIRAGMVTAWLYVALNWIVNVTFPGLDGLASVLVMQNVYVSVLAVGAIAYAVVPAGLRSGPAIPSMLDVILTPAGHDAPLILTKTFPLFS
jgi:hypothetical protein